jgi:hypothetical protein
MIANESYSIFMCIGETTFMVDVYKQVSLPKHNLKESLFMCFNLYQEFGILGYGNTNQIQPRKSYWDWLIEML